MTVAEALAALRGAPKSWLGGAAQVLLAELERLDDGRIAGLESDRCVAQAALRAAQDDRDQLFREAAYQAARADSATSRALDAERQLAAALKARDEAAADANQAHVDSNEHARLLRLEAAARGLLKLGAFVRRATLRAALVPHLTR